MPTPRPLALKTMEDDIDSEDEGENLREGLVAVKFSKDLKNEIRCPWT